MRIDESEDSRSQVISQLIHRPIKVPVTKPLLAQERKRFAGTGSQEKLTKNKQLIADGWQWKCSSTWSQWASAEQTLSPTQRSWQR